MQVPDFQYRYSPDCNGNKNDLSIFPENLWLQDTEINYFIESKLGRWWIFMVFISTYSPLKFICREIDHYPSRKQAEMFAKMLQRNMGKDPRGTIRTRRDAFNICYN